MRHGCNMIAVVLRLFVMANTARTSAFA